LAAAWICGLLTPALGARVYFSSDQDVERPIAEAIDRTTNSIQAALYEINSPLLIRALKRAAARGVHVELLLQRGASFQHSANDDFLSHFDMRWSGGRLPSGLMHHKFAIFDQSLMVTGSYNWTRGARRANYENALFEDDADVVKAYMRQFGLLWSRSSDEPTHSGPFNAAASRKRRHFRSRFKIYR